MNTNARVVEAGLRSSWNALAARVAAIAGVVAALLALFHEAPVSRACLRGALAFIAVRLVARAGWWAVRRSAVPEISAEPSKD